MSTTYPFDFLDILVSSLTFKRAAEIGSSSELPIAAEIKVSESNFPILQINLKLKTSSDSPLSFDIECIALFKYVGDKKEHDRELNKKFVFERVLSMLWIFARQTIKTVTSQMGMNPISLNIPASFDDMAMYDIGKK